MPGAALSGAAAALPNDDGIHHRDVAVLGWTGAANDAYAPRSRGADVTPKRLIRTYLIARGVASL
jgi:hypothetical protein